MSFQEANSGKHIDDIISRTACAHHYAAQGFPCFTVKYDDGKGTYGPAICGSRIRKAGFNGIINPVSLSRSNGKSRLGR